MAESGFLFRLRSLGPTEVLRLPCCCGNGSRDKPFCCPLAEAATPDSRGIPASGKKKIITFNSVYSEYFFIRLLGIELVT